MICSFLWLCIMTKSVHYSPWKTDTTPENYIWFSLEANVASDTQGSLQGPTCSIWYWAGSGCKSCHAALQLEHLNHKHTCNTEGNKTSAQSNTFENVVTKSLLRESTSQICWRQKKIWEKNFSKMCRRKSQSSSTHTLIWGHSVFSILSSFFGIMEAWVGEKVH